MKEELQKIGMYDLRFNDILDINYDDLEIYQSNKGLRTHLIKRKHFNCLQYIEKTSEIINNPDYIGINPNEKGDSIEFIKKYSENIQVAVKLESKGEYYYVATIHDLQESKMKRRLNSGRIIKVDKNN